MLDKMPGLDINRGNLEQELTRSHPKSEADLLGFSSYLASLLLFKCITGSFVKIHEGNSHNQDALPAIPYQVQILASRKRDR